MFCALLSVYEKCSTDKVHVQTVQIHTVLLSCFFSWRISDEVDIPDRLKPETTMFLFVFSHKQTITDYVSA